MFLKESLRSNLKIRQKKCLGSSGILENGMLLVVRINISSAIAESGFGFYFFKVEDFSLFVQQSDTFFYRAVVKAALKCH